MGSHPSPLSVQIHAMGMLKKPLHILKLAFRMFELVPRPKILKGYRK